MRRLLPALLILFLGTTMVAASVGEQGDWEVGAYAGYAILDDFQSMTLGDLDPENGPLYGVRFGYFFNPMISLEGAYQRVSSSTRFEESLPLEDTDLDIDSYRVNVLVNTRPGMHIRPFLLLGLGQQSYRDSGFLDGESSREVNIGAGFRQFLTDSGFNVRVDIVYSIVDVDNDAVSQRQRNLEGQFGIGWAFGGQVPLDTDGDGVTDRRDRCPQTPLGAVVDKYGCPVDTDGDGVPDGLDRCADTPEGWPVDHLGCPLDTDGDGVPDGIDQCAETPGGATVDRAGCPADPDGDGVFDGIDQCADTPGGATVDEVGCPLDSDADGVFDGIDQCPNTPQGATVDATGCPGDADGDGVYDGLDQCPNTPMGVSVDEQGCRVLFGAGQDTLVLEGLEFASNSAEIPAEFMPMLDSVAASLVRNAAIQVEVGGYTDSTGDEAHNMDLSQQRAQAVVDHLVIQGVDSYRLTATGYGPANPIADNSTPEGRGLNRRIELQQAP